MKRLSSTNLWLFHIQFPWHPALAAAILLCLFYCGSAVAAPAALMASMLTIASMLRSYESQRYLLAQHHSQQASMQVVLLAVSEGSIPRLRVGL